MQRFFTFFVSQKMRPFLYIFFGRTLQAMNCVLLKNSMFSKSQFLNVSKKQNFNIDFHSFHRDYPRFFCLKIQGVWILLRTRGTLFLNYYEVEWSRMKRIGDHLDHRRFWKKKLRAESRSFYIEGVSVTLSQAQASSSCPRSISLGKEFIFKNFSRFVFQFNDFDNNVFKI